MTCEYIFNIQDILTFIIIINHSSNQVNNKSDLKENFYGYLKILFLLATISILLSCPNVVD